jgi:hypothetical protein
MKPPRFSLVRAVARALRRSAQGKHGLICGLFARARAHPPYPPGAGAQAPPRGSLVRARLSERSSEAGRHSSYPAKSAAAARGISREYRLGLSGPLVRSSGGHGARPVGSRANGRRRGVPAYIFVARWPRAAFLGVLGPTRGPRTARSTMKWKSHDED